MNKNYITIFAMIFVLTQTVNVDMAIIFLALAAYTALLAWKKERMVNDKFRSEVRKNLEELKPLVMTCKAEVGKTVQRSCETERINPDFSMYI